MIIDILRILLTRSMKPLVFTNNTDYKLDINVKELGIYVHIPFCKTLCSFCPYNKVLYNHKLMKEYKNALINEINMMGKVYDKSTRITSVYFGGGTPALMLEELEDILKVLKANFAIEKSIGIELHPSDISEESLKRLRNIGFDMASIGIQSFQDKCLRTLERASINGAEKVRLAKAAGFTTIDVDLIFGIVNQSEEDLRRDFFTAFECGASQVSTYPFIDFSYANNKSKPLDKKEKKQLLTCLERTSKEIACDRTSVWTFGLKKTEKYSSITRDLYIGFGPSAATLLKDVFKVNTFSVEAYIDAVNSGNIPTSLSLRFNERTRALYWAFWNAYTLKMSNKEFSKVFTKNIERVLGVELLIGRALGIIKKAGDDYNLTERGAYIYHLIEQRYTCQYIDKMWGKSSKEAWPKEIKLY